MKQLQWMLNCNIFLIRGPHSLTMPANRVFTVGLWMTFNMSPPAGVRDFNFHMYYSTSMTPFPNRPFKNK